MNDFRDISCNACGASDQTVLKVIDQYRAVRCNQCRLIFVNPMPFFAHTDFDSVSSDFYYTKLQKQVTDFEIARAEQEFALLQSEWSGHLKTGGESRSLVDVGCGSGVFVKAAVANGWAAEGCDIDGSLTDFGHDQFGLRLKHADLVGSEYTDDAYDVVRFKFVLEHLPDPYDVLVEASRILKPGGVVSIAVPNEAGLVNAARLRLGQRCRDRWGTLIVPHHLHAYAPRTLRPLLQRAGFTNIRVKTATPTDLAYAPLQERAGWANKVAAPVWSAATLFGAGSILVAQAEKPTPPARRLAA